MYTILIVEDDPVIADKMAGFLRSWGYQADCATDFGDVAGQVLRKSPDLVIMDLYLPGINGFQWTRTLRSQSAVPILFVTSAAENASLVTALTSGADDYLAKPFDLQVLACKVHAILRRTYDMAGRQPWTEHKGLRFYPDAFEIRANGKTAALTKNEARIMHMLLERKGCVISRTDLMNGLWQTDLYVDENTLSVNINRLRKKIAALGLEDYIETRKGAGYKT